MHKIFEITKEIWDKKERTETDKKLVALLEMDGQIKNGGFNQWVDNGYASKDFGIIRKTLKEMGTQTTKTIDNLLTQIEPFIKHNAKYEGFSGNYWNENDEEDYYEDDEEDCCEEEKQEPGREIAESLDDLYYNLDDCLLDELVLFVSNHSLPKIEWKTSSANSYKPKKPRVKLIGLDGNAFFIVGQITKALRKEGQTELVGEFQKEAMSKDYDHLLTTAMKYCDIY